MSDKPSGGLPCPACESMQCIVIDSRRRRFTAGSNSRKKVIDPCVRRRRKCLACGTRFTTEERYRVDTEPERPPTACADITT